MENLIVIVLASGERTQKSAISLLKEQVAEEQIFIIDKAPLSGALKDFYTLGIELEAPWILRLDADVLLGKNAISEMMKVAMALPEEVMGYQGTFLDKLTGTARRCGQKLYRQESLPVFLKQIEKNKDLLNPEQPVIHGSFEKRWAKNFEQVLGLHDALQYNRDIYRKGFMFAFKHLQRAKDAIEFWRQEKTDPDFRVALKGLADGIRHQGSVHFDRDFFPEYKGEEKEPLAILQSDDVSKMMRDFCFAPHFQKFMDQSSLKLDYCI